LVEVDVSIFLLPLLKPSLHYFKSLFILTPQPYLSLLYQLLQGNSVISVIIKGIFDKFLYPSYLHHLSPNYFAGDSLEKKRIIVSAMTHKHNL